MQNAINTNIADDGKVVLEQNKRLSDSLIWTIERDYFNHQGIHAWTSGQTPFYVTNNPFIARAYAKIMTRFIWEWAEQNPQAKNHPFYIIELGAGTGRLSFYILKAIQELQHDLKMNDISIVYVLTDFAQQNLDFYKTHSAFVPFLEKGMVDFAHCDLKLQKPIHLMKANIELTQKTLFNPLIACANYVFDTLPMDAFAVQNGKLFESCIRVTTNRNNMKDNLPIDLKKITVEHSLHEIHTPYYHNAALDAVLDSYKKNLKDAHFLIPIDSIHGLDWLRKLANNQFVLIASEKAYCEIESLEGLTRPAIAFHGDDNETCFSMMVNLHAVGEYFKNNNGSYIAHSSGSGLKTCVFSSGINIGEFTETIAAMKDTIEKFSPADFFHLYRHAIEHVKDCNLEMIVSLLQLSGWDPYVFIHLSPRILAIVNDSNIDTVVFLVRHINELADNYFYLPNTDCVFLEIGDFCYTVKFYEKALEYYQLAHEFIGDQFVLLYNTALCYHHLNQPKEALSYFKQALLQDTNSHETQKWIDHLEKTVGDEKDQLKHL